ncbi:Glutamine amidotransferase [Gammaproteobacteria bacterium]
MKPILIFRHWTSEGPGYLADFLNRHSLPWRLIAIDAGEPVPDTLADASALVFMGGPMSVNDALDWIAQEVALIQAAQAVGMPVLGHCLGGQLIAKAMGGVVTRNSMREIGWLPVIQADNTVALDWLSGLPSTFDAFHWHGETFSLPVEASLILSSRHCLHQGFVMGNTLALQCHVEMTEDLVQAWATDNSPEIATPSETVQSAVTMMANLSSRIEGLRYAADRLYKRWLRPLIGEI